MKLGRLLGWETALGPDQPSVSVLDVSPELSSWTLVASWQSFGFSHYSSFTQQRATANPTFRFNQNDEMRLHFCSFCPILKLHFHMFNSVRQRLEPASFSFGLTTESSLPKFHRQNPGCVFSDNPDLHINLFSRHLVSLRSFFVYEVCHWK